MLNILRDLLGVILFILASIFCVLFFFATDTILWLGGKVTKKYINKLLKVIVKIINNRK